MFEILRQIRKAEGLSCEDMSCVIGLKTKSAYHKKENGNVPFSLDEAKKISQLFNLPIDNIFFANEVSKQDTAASKQGSA